MATCTIFRNFNIPVEDKSLIVIAKNIREGKYKPEIEHYRQLLNEGRTSEAEIAKKQLLAFTPSATFHSGRKPELLNNYSGFVHLDFDKIDMTVIENIFDKICSIPFTAFCFHSPSQNGLKVFVEVSTGSENHESTYANVRLYYENLLGILADPKCKDITRLCFVSYDPDCYRNINAEIFDLSKALDTQKANNTEIPKINQDPIKVLDSAEDADIWLRVYNKCVDLTERNLSYHEGSRNNFLYQLSCNCNRAGMPENVTKNYILQNFDLDSKESLTTIHSAYSNNIADFAKFANSAKKSDSAVQSKDEILMNMPFLPDTIYDQLPEILRNGAAVFEDRRERDVFLTGALSILSGCMRNVVGLYRAKEHFANLFVFIIAPAASGKGSMTFAKNLGDKVHDKFVKKSNDDVKIYKIELQEYRRKINNRKLDTSELSPPEEPPFKVLYIPANNSSARVIQHLKEGDEQGIFCETEADTMGAVFKQDWGSYSDLLRKAFHHEPISYSRKANKEWIEIKNPRLSVALAGTPGQVENLIRSAEDGLFSRFIFYVFKSDVVWTEAGETLNGINLTTHFEQISDQVLNFVDFLDNQEQITFKLTDSQWAKLNEYGADCLTTLATFVSEDLSGTSKRLGLILYRISMILTALRRYDDSDTLDLFTCEDEDFEIALSMVKVYQEHSVFMFKELPKQTSVTDKLLKQFYDILPVSIHRKDAIDLALNQFDIKERTADLYLSKLVTFKLLEKTKNGIYQKQKH